MRPSCLYLDAATIGLPLARCKEIVPSGARSFVLSQQDRAFLFLRVCDGRPDPGAALDVAVWVDRWPVSQVSSSCASLNVGTANAASAIVMTARITVLFRSSAKMTNDSA